MNRDFINGILYYDLSDHLPIFTITNEIHANEKPVKTYNKRRKETNHTIELLKSDLAQEQWLDIFQENEFNEAYEKCIKNLFLLREKHPSCPSQTF